MGHYSSYRGRSVGRVLHCLDTYMRHFPRLDETQVGDGCVWMDRKLLATYTWPDPIPLDSSFVVPIINWDVHPPIGSSPAYGLDARLIQSFAANQLILWPFVDDMFLPSMAPTFVQAIRDGLTFKEALAIRHVRDVLQKDWARYEECNNDEIQKKIIHLVELAHGGFSPEEWRFFIQGQQEQMTMQAFMERFWGHFAMCAVFDI